MPMNTFSFSQAATVLNGIVKQATGRETIQPIATPQDFVSVAQTALLNGADPVLNAISQMWSRTIFANRDYRAPLDSLMMELPRYGNATRKISPVAMDMVNDSRYEWPVAYDAVGHQANALGNGESVDMYKINKQDALQTNFYGTAIFEQDYTIFRDQFDSAFRDADEFARFNSMMMTERQNDRETYRQNVARALQANYIGGIIKEGQATRVVHLLAEYKTQTGLNELTAQTIYQPENFAPFMRWVYARIKTISRMMAERSQLYQTVINGKPILRHTSAENLRVALYAPAMAQMEAMVLSDTYNDNYLKYATFDAVNFWQSIETPDSISVNPVYTGTNGAVVTSNEETEQAGIFGVLHDRDALGYAAVNDWNSVTPFNSKGGYWNEHYHSTFKTISDMTEKGVVLLLD